MDDWGSSLTIVHRWFSPKYIGLVVFCVFWDGFLVFWYSMAFTTGAPLVMVLFPLIHLAVGVFLTYATAAGFVNRTRIQVEPDSLTIRHGPMPWPGNRTISSIDIEQLFTKEKVSHGKHGTTITYELHAAVREGGKVKLVSGLDDPDQVLYMEQEIEARLKIQDRPVAGELPR
jgi:hypothetical protein